MTRLNDDFLDGTGRGLVSYEREFRAFSGLGFFELGCKACGLSSKRGKEILSRRIGVVPITSGDGIIGTFAGAVTDILEYTGFTVFVTDNRDVNGFAEAHTEGADAVFMADDERFIAVNLNSRRISDNNRATALGFITALEGAADGLAGKDVLILGYGVVGSCAAYILRQKGANPVIFDTDPLKQDICSSEIADYKYIFDATPEGGWLTADMLHKDALAVYAGVPLSLDSEARARFKGRFVHDNLSTGVIVMAFDALGV
ncbi:MAG: 3-methylornithyl-N6-L-lysine dehydrogenase PylD [Defluviitaleaceae bacterium]|nr:3-methylornithyl-N6-L-lysine dehydrogenase PylD [Defluviitaleaceae bacterium]MCL2836631.1 3-methylornithyl-N6-L-lysine dehydrogenase PylD [Defluviitaleaceae bacterium]